MQHPGIQHSGATFPAAFCPTYGAPFLPSLLQVLKERITCPAEVIAVSAAGSTGSTATVRLDVFLPASVWSGHHRWHDSPAAAQLFAHLVPPPSLLPETPGEEEEAAAGAADAGAATAAAVAQQAQQEAQRPQQEGQPVSYLQLLRQGLPDLRPVPEGADPFR